MTRHHRSISSPLALGLAALLLAPFGSSALAAAADPGLLPTELLVAEEKPEQGWFPKLTLGASLSLSSNSNVVGQADGSSWTIGLNLLGRMDYLESVHDWRNTLKLQEVLSRTPVIDDWVKTVDQLLFESVYYLRVSETVGPFVSFKLETSLFEGTDLRAAPVTYVAASDATVLAATATRLKLTDGFQPLTLKEAIGAFYTPVKEKRIEVDIRAGFGAQQTFAEGGLVLADVGDTPEIEVARLEDFVQGGFVVGVEAGGQFEEGRVAYSARAEVMFPIINDDDADRSVIDLTNVDLATKISFKLFSFATLDYEFKAFRLPALVDSWQIQNSLLLTFSLALIE